MASTMSGNGKASRGKIHIYKPSGLQTLCGRGGRAVSIEGRYIADCTACISAATRMVDFSRPEAR